MGSEEHRPSAERAWEREARNWIAWARTPGHDAYWVYRDAFFREIVPSPQTPGPTLEIGCGEGRVARDLAARGHRVVAVDLSETLVGAAAEADTAGRYVRATAATLPFGDGAFGTVVAYNSLMDVDDMPAAVAEAARVLGPGGCLCVSVTHPVNDAGVFLSEAPDAAFVIDGDYLGSRPLRGTFERDGLSMTFAGWAHPLEAYVDALEAAGLVLERLREPLPDLAGAGARVESYRRWQRVPMFLFLRAARPDRSGRG